MWSWQEVVIAGVAIGAVTALSLVALRAGVDGAILMTALTVIGGIAGWTGHAMKCRLKSESNRGGE